MKSRTAAANQLHSLIDIAGCGVGGPAVGRGPVRDLVASLVVPDIHFEAKRIYLCAGNRDGATDADQPPIRRYRARRRAGDDVHRSRATDAADGSFGDVNRIQPANLSLQLVPTGDKFGLRVTGPPGAPSQPSLTFAPKPVIAPGVVTVH